MMSEPALKCEKQAAIFKQNYTQEQFIPLEMVYYCGFSLGGKLENLDFLQKKFYNINCGQSYKHFMLVNYDSRVVIWGIFQSGMTLES